MWGLRIVEPRLVLFQVDDQLCGAGWQDSLERVRLRVVLVHPDRFDERIERRPRNTVTIVHDVAWRPSVRVKLSLAPSSLADHSANGHSPQPHAKRRRPGSMSLAAQAAPRRTTNSTKAMLLKTLRIA